MRRFAMVGGTATQRADFGAGLQTAADASAHYSTEILVDENSDRLGILLAWRQRAVRECRATTTATSFAQYDRSHPIPILPDEVIHGVQPRSATTGSAVCSTG